MLRWSVADRLTCYDRRTMLREGSGSEIDRRGQNRRDVTAAMPVVVRRRLIAILVRIRS